MKKIFYSIFIVLVTFSFVFSANAKTLTVGLNIDNPPFEFYDEKHEAVGFEVDLINAMAKKAGYDDVKLQDFQWSGLIPALMGGKVDVLVGPMTITDERKKMVNFLNPHYKSGLIIMVKNDNKNINSSKDLVGKKVAVSVGSTADTFISNFKDVKVIKVDTGITTLLEMNKVDAIVWDLPMLQYYIKTAKNNDAKLVGEVMEAENYGFSVAKKNTELKKVLDNALKEVKKNGEYDKIYKTWFGDSK